MNSRCLKLLKLKNFLSIDFQRNLRKKSIDDLTKQNEKLIQVVNKNINVDSVDLPPAAHLTLKSNPKLIDDIKIKELKFGLNYEKFENQLDQIEPKFSLNPFDLEEDPTYKRNSANCSGCGAYLQCNDKMKEGFIDAKKLKILSKKELNFTICFRCEYLKTTRKLLNVTAESFDYDKFIMEKIISQKKAHVVILVDLLDLPNSIYEGWSKLIRKDSGIDITILGNKFDLLPNTGPNFEKSIIECLLTQCSKKGLNGDQIKYVDLISAKTGFNIEKVISKFFKLWNDEGDVYLLGMANAGKSVLFNKLLSSDYCRPLASEALVRATTSFWPGTTLNNLKFPITLLTPKKDSLRRQRLEGDLKKFIEIEEKRKKRYEKDHDLKDAEVFGLVNTSFKKYSVIENEIDVENIQATYSMNEGVINEGDNFENTNELKEKFKKDAREIYRPNFYKDKSTWFYDTPGVLGSQKILQNFSKKELEIVFPINMIMPRIYWMIPGQSLFVGGLIRLDLLESTNDERVLFSIMASPALPIINPFKTEEADGLYEKYYNEGNVLRVPHKNHIREEPLPQLKSKTFEISCIGNYKATSDIVFSCFGWTAVTSRPDVKAKIRAYTLGGDGLELREPSLLPYIVNFKRKWDRKDGSQSFKAVYYKKPNLFKYF